MILPSCIPTLPNHMPRMRYRLKTAVEGIAVAALFAVLPALASSASADGATSRIEQVGREIARNYERSPVLVIAIGAAMATPLLALLMMSARHLARRRREPHAPVVRALRELEAGSALDPAWLERAGARPHPLEAELVRIGRESDNELRLNDGTVHRYHALIQRSREGGYLLLDISGSDGNGVSVNGARVASAQLNDGDRIEIGGAAVTFRQAPRVVASLAITPQGS